MWERSFVRSAAAVRVSSARLDAIDRRIIEATQTGLPVTSMPYHAIADQLGLEPQLVMTKMKRMQRQGIIRRIAAVPNHYALGYLANAMTVWDVRDDRVSDLGNQVGRLPFVSHCYQRPRYPPEWPYNLFAMVHGRNREETAAKVLQIAAFLGEDSRDHAVLYSTRILKKTGLRIGSQV